MKKSIVTLVIAGAMLAIGTLGAWTPAGPDGSEKRCNTKAMPDALIRDNPMFMKYEGDSMCNNEYFYVKECTAPVDGTCQAVLHYEGKTIVCNAANGATCSAKIKIPKEEYMPVDPASGKWRRLL